MKRLIRWFKWQWSVMVNASDDNTPFIFAMIAFVIAMIALMK